MISLKSRAISEVAILLLLGGASAVLMVALEGEDGLKKLFGAMVPPDPVFWWCVLLTASFPLAWLIDHAVYPEHKKLKYIVAFVVYCLQQAGSATLGLYRFVGGSVLAFITIWNCFEPGKEALIKSIPLAALGVGCALMTFVLSWLHDWLTERMSNPLAKLQSDAL